MRRLSYLVVGAMVLLSACAGQHPKAARISSAQIAVLPVHNETRDPDGPQVVRRLVQRWLAERGYVTVPQSVVDEELAKMGVRDIDQLTATELQDVQRRTGADTAAAIDLLDFSAVNRGFSHERRVGLSIRLMALQTGQVLWQNSDQEVNTGSTINPTTAVYDYLKGWGAAVMEKALNSPLFPESSKLIARMLKGLPIYSVTS